MTITNHVNITDILQPTEIPIMHYGIINRFNFSSIDKIPIKRWDPLSASLITLNEYGYQIILQKKFGHYSYISPIRSVRPFDRRKDDVDLYEPDEKIERDPDEPIDVFEPMLKGKHYISEDPTKIKTAHAIIISDGNKPVDDPFTDIVKTYPGLSGNAVTMINKYPAMVRVIDPEILPYINRTLKQEDVNSKLAMGVCLLTIPRNYYEKVENIPAEEIRDIFISMNTAIKSVIKEAVSQKGISVIPIAPFINVGRFSGGSLKRIHSQVYMDLSQDGHGSRLESILKSFENMKKQNHCILCDSHKTEEKRIIIDNDDWIVFASGSPIRNYHLRFTSKEHIENFYDVDPEKLLSLAKLLKILNAALNDLGVNSNRNLIFNTKPYGYQQSYYHIFGDILPYEFVGGAEMADDMRVVRKSPKEVAKDLRDLINTKYREIL